MGLTNSKPSADTPVEEPQLEDEPQYNQEELFEQIKEYIDERLKPLQQHSRELEGRAKELETYSRGLEAHSHTLETENMHYKSEYEQLYQKHEALIQKMELASTHSKISEKAIDDFVKTLMSDPKTNIRGFPDAIESALYKKALKTIMYAVAHTVEVTSLRFMGHKIRITIEPEEDGVSTSTH